MNTDAVMLDMKYNIISIIYFNNYCCYYYLLFCLVFQNVQLLSQFVSPNTGRIFGRHITKLCEAQQRRVAKAVKRAITMGR